MAISHFQKEFIKKNIRSMSLRDISENLNLSENELKKYALKRFGKKIFNQALHKPEQSKEKLVLHRFFTENFRIFLFLFLLALLSYFNALGNGFVSDDIPAFVNNPDLGKIESIFKYGLIGSPEQFIFFLGNNIGGVAPAFFRAFNILFHIGSTFLIFLLFSLLYKKRLALLTAALFAVHPILTESVSWISGIPYSMSGFFILLSFFTYFYKNRISWSLTFFFIALLTMEKVMILPLILLLYDYSSGGIQKIKNNWKKLSLFFGLSFLWIFIFLGKLGNRVSALETTGYQQSGDSALYNPFFQIPVAIGNYLKLIFWPDKLTLYHTEMSFSTSQFLGFLFIFLIFLGLIFWSWKKNKTIFFWLSFFFITLLPTLTPFKIAWIVAERYVYLGSVGIFVVVAIFFDFLIEKAQKKERREYKYVIYGIFAIIILSLSIRTIVRNTDWKNEDSLWIATAKVSPSGQNIHNNLGDVYGRHGNLEKAEEEFKKAIAINPRYADAYHNLGNTYRDMKKTDLAVENYQKALEFNPGLWQSWQNLGVIYYEKKDYAKATECLQKALGLIPENEELKKALELIQAQK